MRPSAVSMPQRDDLLRPRVEFCHHQSSLIGFSTTVGKVALLQTTWCNFSKFFSQRHYGLIDIKRGGMLNLLHLSFNGRIDLGMTMTNTDREYSSKKVQVR